MNDYVDNVKPKNGIQKSHPNETSKKTEDADHKEEQSEYEYDEEEEGEYDEEDDVATTKKINQDS